MGLGRRACKSVRVILPFDTSLQWEDREEDSLPIGYKEYMDSIYTDESCLVIDKSDPPVRFTLQQWTDEHKDRIAAQETQRAMWKMGVRCALRSMSNYFVLRDGVEAPAPEMMFRRDGKLGEIVTSKWMSEVNFPDTHLEHIYIAARHHSEAAPPLSKRSEQEHGEPKSESPEATGE